MKKFFSFLISSLISTAVLGLMVLPVHANEINKSIMVKDFDYTKDTIGNPDPDTYYINIKLSNSESGDINFGSDSSIYLRRNISQDDENDDYKYDPASSRYYLGLYLQGSYSSQCTAVFTDPLFNETITINFTPTYSHVRIWFFANNQTKQIIGISDSEGVTGASATITGGRFSTESSDWLDPLRTQLHIAADPEFGGNVNHTAEYTGDFALPTEIMAYIKAHEGVTLNYSFYVDDVLQTVTITSDNVVLEKGVDWYGFSYLLNHYGKGTKGASGGYTIVSGDTLTSIAAKFGTTVQALAAKNGIKNVDLIYAGAKIAY